MPNVGPFRLFERTTPIQAFASNTSNSGLSVRQQQESQQNILTGKLGAFIILTRKLGREVPYGKRRYLGDQPQRKQNRDLAEAEISAQAGSIASRIGAGTCCFVSVLFVWAANTMLFSPWIIYFSILGTHYLVRFIKAKRENRLNDHRLVFRNVHSLLRLFCFAAY